MVGIASWRFCPGEHSPSCTAVSQVSVEIRWRFTAIAYPGIIMTRRIMTFFGIVIKAFLEVRRAFQTMYCVESEFALSYAFLEISCYTKKCDFRLKAHFAIFRVTRKNEIFVCFRILRFFVSHEKTRNATSCGFCYE